MAEILQKNRPGRSSTFVSADVAVSIPEAGTIRLRHAGLFARRDGEPCRAFLNRVFRIQEVSRVQIDPSRHEAEIHYQKNGARQPGVLARLASALRQAARQRDESTTAHLHLGGDGSSPLRVYRHGTTVSTWEIVHQLPGRLRLRHEQLSGRRRAVRYLEQELGTTFGVIESQAHFRTGTVLIHFNERAVTTCQLLRIVEGLLYDFDNPRGRGYAHPEDGTLGTNATLALAALGEFAFAPLLPLCGALLVTSNVDTLRSALRELRQRRPGLSLLYVLIIAATIATGGFFTAALMSWFIRYWDRRSHRQLAHAQRELLADFRRKTRFAWLCRGDVEIRVAVDQLRLGDTVVVRAGEMIPADGVVRAGRAEVDERLLRGVDGMTYKAAGDWGFAGSLIFDGHITLQIGKTSHQSRAASITRALEDSSTPGPNRLQDRGKSFAERTVAPTLAAAGVGMAIGDIATALAILRPDYWSGPGMSGPLGNLHDVVACAQRGIVVRDVAAFQRFSESEVLLIDLRCAVDGWQATRTRWSHGSGGALYEMARSLRQLRRGNSLRVGLISEGRPRDVARCADFLGADFFQGGLSPGAKAALIRDHAERGTRVAFVGDCRAHEQAARHAHLAISTGDICYLEDDPAHVFLLDSQLFKLNEFWNMTRTQKRRQRVHESCTVLPNLACVAGAFLLGFTSLHTVLITNLGVYTVYRSGTQWLRRLRSQQPRQAGHALEGDDRATPPCDLTLGFCSERENNA